MEYLRGEQDIGMNQPVNQVSLDACHNSAKPPNGNHLANSPQQVGQPIKYSPDLNGTRTTKPFLSKAYALIEDPSTNEIVSWRANGDSFIIHNIDGMSRMVLPCYFKHSNFSSFVRQLNTYGFKKVNTNLWEFAHPGFTRGVSMSALASIRRKQRCSGSAALHKKVEEKNLEQLATPTMASIELAVKSLQEEISSLRGTVEQVRQENQAIKQLLYAKRSVELQHSAVMPHQPMQQQLQQQQQQPPQQHQQRQQQHHHHQQQQQQQQQQPGMMVPYEEGSWERTEEGRGAPGSPQKWVDQYLNNGSPPSHKYPFIPPAYPPGPMAPEAYGSMTSGSMPAVRGVAMSKPLPTCVGPDSVVHAMREWWKDTPPATNVADDVVQMLLFDADHGDGRPDAYDNCV